MQYFILAAMIVILLSLARTAQAAFEEELLLKNGLKVLMAPQPSNPIMSVQLVIKSGSGAEKDRAEFGLAHLMEHMAFKSTAGGREEGQIAWEVESAGGSIGAYTWLDETVYQLSFPTEVLMAQAHENSLSAFSVEKAFDILRDMVFSPAYEPSEFNREKEVVVEEIKKYIDSPSDILIDNLYGLAFKNEAYGHPVIGYEDTVREATKEKVLAFMARNYRPDNMILVLSGGFKPDSVKPLLMKYFACLPTPVEYSDKTFFKADEYLSLANQQNKSQKRPEIVMVTSPKTDLVLAEIAFRSFPGRDADSVPAELLAAVLSQTQAGRLDENVKSRLGLVSSVSCQSSSFRAAGLFSIYLETEPEQLVQATAAILEELERLAIQPPSEDELKRARAMDAVYFLSQQESSEGLGRVLAECDIFLGDWRLKDAMISQLDRVGTDDLLRIARKIFQPENMFVSAVLPQKAADKSAEIEKAISARSSSLCLEKGPREELVVEQFLEEVGWPGGPRLFVARDPALPFITIKAGVLGGLLAEDKSTEGLSSFAAEVWPLAAGAMNRPKFLRAAERLGASFCAASGRNTFFLTTRFPSKNKDEALALMAEIIKAPLFPAEEVEECRQERLADLRQQAEEPAAQLALISMHALFGENHPYGLNPLGRKETVAAFTSEALSDFYKKIVRPEKMAIIVTGDVERPWLKGSMEMLLGGWRAEEPQTRPLAAPEFRPREEKATTIKEFMDRAQTHIRITFPAPGLGHKDQATLEVLSDYLGGGMGGPLFVELREKRSLAYDLYTHYMPGLGGGEFIFYIATDQAKAGEALAGLESVIGQCRESLLEPEVLAGARLLTLGKRKRGEETTADRAEAALLALLYGLGLDFEARHQAAIQAVSGDALKAAAETYLRMDRALVAAVGPEKSLALIP